jgi:alpha-beta hydrolase superfamily lysophospholipase
MKETITFPSAAEGVTVRGYFFAPEGAPRAIVQLSHGMIDRIGHYDELILALVKEGFAVVGNDHIGHGETAETPEAFGHFGRRGARRDLVTDLHEMSLCARRRFGELPLVLVGHSMGSFLARLYAAKYGAELSALVLLGTSGKNPAVPFGKLLADLLTLLRGRRYRSQLLAKMTFMGYLSHYREEKSHLSWLTRDPACRKEIASDALCHFIFTVSAYRELFSMLSEVNSRACFKATPRTLPILVASGTEDPVGAYGKGVKQVAASFSRAGVEHLALRLYEGARHELHHETNRDEFFSELVSYLSEVIR